MSILTALFLFNKIKAKRKQWEETFVSEGEQSNLRNNAGTEIIGRKSDWKLEYF